ncbi:hypothetical protein DL766_000985 [Monosporascus sp. MC13-8B]|uniref:Uncharacterized protein n=1 Tax=Monosporascus cannonballus TaxID=155416 RepID=A0ABY0H7V4_9PEZI|nr:hypothetical protein DL762_005900 [Monosporascus cannonballus]RYO92695.1 hypothetical protein DL763_004608 [Monosporascus cannonballus]RYP38407.1 hypothetical protein DL766_000985 [Monosporascus sp. MC13-8B]
MAAVKLRSRNGRLRRARGPAHPSRGRTGDRTFGSYDAIIDRGADYVEELAVACCDAKVVVVERDFECWWRSFEAELVNRLLIPSEIVAG